MKLALQAILIISLLSCNQINIKQINEDDLIRRIVEEKMPNPENVQIFNINGKEISLDSLRVLESTGKYFEDFYVNEGGEIVKIVVRNKTKNDDILIAKIHQKLNEGPDLNSVSIDCKDKANILQTVIDRDQGMRLGENEIDSKIDHENLEIIVSFLEQCGMPSLEEVNDRQMSGIWAVLQHAPQKYQSKYIPLLEESANKGDIQWGVIALMKDRALMYEGKPQIYGSQVRNGELYDLIEPEYVNQRREGIGMQPIEQYLEKFGIDFNIEQKRK